MNLIRYIRTFQGTHYSTHYTANISFKSWGLLPTAGHMKKIIIYHKINWKYCHSKLKISWFLLSIIYHQDHPQKVHDIQGPRRAVFKLGAKYLFLLCLLVKNMSAVCGADFKYPIPVPNWQFWIKIWTSVTGLSCLMITMLTYKKVRLVWTLQYGGGPKKHWGKTYKRTISHTFDIHSLPEVCTVCIVNPNFPKWSLPL